MTIFVDGYNLIFAAAKKIGGYDISRTEEAREKLLELLGKYKAARGDRIVVFFDGGPDAAHLPRHAFSHGMELVFSDANSDADTDIKNAVSHDDHPRNIRVITSDGAIRNFVKRYYAAVTDSFRFLDEVLLALQESALPQDEPMEKYEDASGDDVDYWMSVFGDMDDEPE